MDIKGGMCKFSQSKMAGENNESTGGDFNKVVPRYLFLQTFYKVPAPQ